MYMLYYCMIIHVKVVTIAYVVIVTNPAIGDVDSA